MLGLPEYTSTGAAPSSVTAKNRSLTSAEAEVLRQANVQITALEKFSPALHAELIGSGAVARLLDHRTPDEDEPRIRMPLWAAQRAVQDGKDYAHRISRTGVRIVGDLAALSAEPNTAGDDLSGKTSADGNTYQRLAIETLVGAYVGTQDFEDRVLKQIADTRKLRKQTTKRERMTTADTVRRLLAGPRRKP